MEIRIVPYSPAEESAAQAFNERLRAGGEVEFQLPSHAPQPEGVSIRKRHFLALEGDTVRGGFLLVQFPGSLAGADVELVNCQDPLSEGIVDPKYSLVALRLMKTVHQHGQYGFAAGLGGEDTRFARLLKGAGYKVQLVPFLFRVIRMRRFLGELQILQNSGLKSALARSAGATGAGTLAISALQSRSMLAALRLRQETIEPIKEWGSWADALWRHFRSQCSFCVNRDRKTLAELYQIGKDRSQAFVIKRGNEPVGWVAALNTKMRNNKYFGNMQVATILDCLAYPDAMEAAIVLATRALAAEGADLVVTNQLYPPWIKAFQRAGFLRSGSNFGFASSKALTEAIDRQPSGWDRIHITRGDGDGRVHL